MTTVGEAFDPRANGLNLIRLLLATGVIVFHSFPITGREIRPHTVEQLLGHGPVDLFFAISGFLIARSWLRRRSTWHFLLARFLRIMPAFWVCLMLTVALIAPLGILIREGSLPSGYLSDAARYLWANFLLQVAQYDIGGSPRGVPYDGVWNGSIWTLRWEVLCYLGVLGLGMAGLLRRTGIVLALFLGCWAVTLAASQGAVNNYWLVTPARLGLMFLAGTLVLLVQAHLVVSRRLIFLAVALTVFAAWSLPDYRLLAALPMAYMAIAGSTYVRSARWQLPNDISYGTYIYAFPLQQLLAGTALLGTPLLVFVTVCIATTWVVAMASWFIVEKPASRLKRSARKTESAVA